MSRFHARWSASLLALVVVGVAASSAVAQSPVKTQQLRTVGPRVVPLPIHPPSRQWHFGMSILRTHTSYGPGLYVSSVMRGGPAWAAGLERGDVLISANGISLQSAASSHHGVALLQSSVRDFAVTTVGYPGASIPPPQPSVRLTVVNVRTNRLVSVTVRPQDLGGPAPVAATTRTVSSPPASSGAR